MTRHECPDCGATFERASRYIYQGRNKPCRHPWIDEATPYAEDLLCQAIVAANPGGLTLDEVGETMGVTRERIRQIEREALRKVRRAVLLMPLRARLELEAQFAEALEARGRIDSVREVQA